MGAETYNLQAAKKKKAKTFGVSLFLYYICTKIKYKTQNYEYKHHFTTKEIYINSH